MIRNLSVQLPFDLSHDFSKEKALAEASAFLAGAGGFEPATHGFGDRYSTS